MQLSGINQLWVADITFVRLQQEFVYVAVILDAYSRKVGLYAKTPVLERDQRCCRVCGAGKSVHIHHRRPGVHDPAWLIALCPACHARVHRTVRFRVWLPDFLVTLWVEQHPQLPLQLQFPLGPAGREGNS